MADYDPGRPLGDWDESEGYGVAGGDQQSNVQHSTEDEAEYSVPQAQNSSGDASDDGASDDMGDEYDPEMVTSDQPLHAPQMVAPLAPLKPSLQPANKKPRAVGGFLVGDSDSEADDDETPPAAQQAPPADQPLRPSPSASPPRLTAQDAMGSTASNQPPVHQAKALMLVPRSQENGAPVVPTYDAPVTASESVAPPPIDKVEQLENRIREDPRGAMSAWLALIEEYRYARQDIEQTRQVYARFLAVFPQAAEIWVAWLDLELSMSDFSQVEQIFGKCLLGTPSVQLYTKYLDYIRRRNDLSSDMSGQARQTVSQAYEFVLDRVGLDKDAGRIWAEYIQFIKSGPGVVGGSQWQDQQKMDQLRKAYQRAICIPIANVNMLWKEYDQFEMGLNKLTGRKYLAEKSPSYMSAKSANTALENITRGLQRTTLPVLPPAPGFDGSEEYMEQVRIWQKWIAWEKSDPLDLKDDKDQPGLFQKRILYVYNQALMALYFWPELWVNAAQWCFDNNVTTTANQVTQNGNANGLEFLSRGIKANPESILLALKHADHIESTYPIEESDEAKAARGAAVRAPYDQVLDTLYGLIKNLKEKEAVDITRAKDRLQAEREAMGVDEDDEDEVARDKAIKDIDESPEIKSIQRRYEVQIAVLSRMISFVWIALIRAMRRVQGKGAIGKDVLVGGMRRTFAEARQKGRLTSDVYAAAAQLEWTIYKDPAGGKIFDRGAKLFPEDEHFALENIKYLHSRDDFTNARVLFETFVNRVTQKPETVYKAKPLYVYMHKYESQFGELAQIAKLEKRMAELFPEDPTLMYFKARYSLPVFDPLATPIIISPETQLRPKLPSIEGPSRPVSPRPGLPGGLRNSPAPFINSPKRPLAIDADDEPPRKIQRNDYGNFQRGVSPLKGAAGRRLDQQRRMQGPSTYTAPAPIASDITFLLGQIPRADLFDARFISSSRMVNLLRETNVPDYSSWKAGTSLRGGQASTGSHNRHVSGDYAGGSGQYGYARDSPAPTGGPSMAFRQSSVRPGSSGSYEPPPAAYGQAPLSAGHYEGGTWPPYGAPAPSHHGTYGAPASGGQGSSSNQGYSRYPY